MVSKRKTLSLKERVDLINSAASGKGCRELANKFNIGKTQASDILKRKAEILDEFESNMDIDRKRKRHKSVHSDLNSVTWDWFLKCRSMNIPVSGPMLQEKALKFAQDLDKTEFKASNGWLESFRKRHNISFNALSGEAADVNMTTVEDWKARIPEIIDGYSMDDIYNCDETCLFYHALPEKSLCVKGSDCKGGKKSKERITVLLCCNASGTDLRKPLVIGKSQTPRCFRNLKVEKLPIVWRANKKAWMNSGLFTEWVKQFDRDMGRAKLRVLLFIDNAPSHPPDLSLKNVKIKWFPPKHHISSTTA